MEKNKSLIESIKEFFSLSVMKDGSPVIIVKGDKLTVKAKYSDGAECSAPVMKQFAGSYVSALTGLKKLDPQTLEAFLAECALKEKWEVRVEGVFNSKLKRFARELNAISPYVKVTE
jgi:hypothetical protein